MAPEFYMTNAGRKFYESDVPRIADALERLAAAQEKANQLKEIELGTTKPSDIAKEFMSGEELSQCQG